MHITVRAAGFSLMTMFVSCGVGAQELDTYKNKVPMAPLLCMISTTTLAAELRHCTHSGNP